MGALPPEDNAETQAFANVLAQGFVPTAKAGEYAFLETPHTFSDNEDADADIDEAELDDGAQDVFGRVDAPELRVRSHREARLLAVQQSCARRAFEERGVDEDDDVEMLSREARGDDDDEMLDERVLRDLSPQVNLGLSSSPAAPLKLNLKHRAVAATASVAQAAHVEDYTQIDVRLSLSASSAFPPWRTGTDPSTNSSSLRPLSLACSTARPSSTASATSRASRPRPSAVAAAQCASCRPFPRLTLSLSLTRFALFPTARASSARPSRRARRRRAAARLAPTAASRARRSDPSRAGSPPSGRVDSLSMESSPGRPVGTP